MLNAFGLEAEDATHVADVMTATFTNSATDLEGLGETMKYAAPVMRAAGISLEETAAARQLGRDSVFSAKEAAQGMSELALAGFETNEIISAMPGLLDMAAAGQVDLATASDITANMLNAFGLEAEEAVERMSGRA